jgi:hypothetical protein
MRQVIVVSYCDGSSIKGVYGVYPGPENARDAMAQMQKLPGMAADDTWEIFPLYEIQLDQPKDAPS